MESFLNARCWQVFLPGMDEICEVQEEIEKRAVLDVSVHVLHSQVPQEDQDSAIAPPPSNCCKVILATNIAESSITISSVEVVVDSGLVRGIYYDDRRKMQCLLSKVSFTREKFFSTFSCFCLIPVYFAHFSAIAQLSNFHYCPLFNLLFPPSGARKRA
jgi:hypothetical protein